MPWLAVLVIGAGVGFLGGLFGKGGSAVATPLLHLVGVPAPIALAAPLPATIPSTLAAAGAYGPSRIDRRVLAWSVAVGAPGTIAGALLSAKIGAGPLVTATDVIVAALGLRFLLAPKEAAPAAGATPADPSPAAVIAVAAVVGLAAGLLANSGGFLLAPLYLAVLRLPVTRAFATSLVASAALAVPGAIAHAALGHLDWKVVLVFGAASIPLARLGARVAVAQPPARLERLYGAVLVTIGLATFAISR